MDPNLFMLRVLPETRSCLWAPSRVASRVGATVTAMPGPVGGVGPRAECALGPQELKSMWHRVGTLSLASSGSGANGQDPTIPSGEVTQMDGNADGTARIGNEQVPLPVCCHEVQYGQT